MATQEDSAASASQAEPTIHDKIRGKMVKTRIVPDLQGKMSPPDAQADDPRLASGATFDVIVEFNASFPSGARTARDLFLTAYIEKAVAEKSDLGPSPAAAAWPFTYSLAAFGGDRPKLDPPLDFEAGDSINVGKSLCTEVFAFGCLTRTTIGDLVNLTATLGQDPSPHRLVHKIWRDHEIAPMVYESVRTIKCDAARAAFGSAGRGIVWAVADTGVQGDHPHFQTHGTLDLPGGLKHCDFTQASPSVDAVNNPALTDTAGHGSHVAGIIAGETFKSGSPAAKPGLNGVDGIEITHDVRSDDGPDKEVDTSQEVVSGIAPLCKIMSLKVLSSERAGNTSNLLAAIGYIQQINGFGRDIKVHGLNLSLGYPFDAAWFAAGQSPLCAEVDRLVKSGVAVVVAAGNAGYGRVATSAGTVEAAALTCTIADPGNAELAITVGSTHRSQPHAFGVSYFSAKGPTADGRMKPDLVAPGERIVSCSIDPADKGVAKYREDSGTSMAAPHVSAAIAAFLSVRAEFIGRPEAVKAIFLGSAMALGRRPEFQGSGLLDLMKALQSV